MVSLHFDMSSPQRPPSFLRMLMKRRGSPTSENEASSPKKRGSSREEIATIENENETNFEGIDHSPMAKSKFREERATIENENGASFEDMDHSPMAKSKFREEIATIENENEANDFEDMDHSPMAKSKELEKWPSENRLSPSHMQGVSLEKDTTSLDTHKNDGGDKMLQTLIDLEMPRVKLRPSVLLRQQRRLLLLRHATMCSTEIGQICPVSSRCSETKKVCLHIANCKSKECSFPQCLTSRYVISHFRRCTDEKCELCGPVTAIINQGHELM